MENNIKYIDKDALVAEIERYKKEALERLTTSIERSIRRQIKDKAWVSLCQNLLSFLDTLEVKEVDLEKECSKYFEDNDLCVHDDYIKFARHFFELGLKAQKGE